MSDQALIRLPFTAVVNGSFSIPCCKPNCEHERYYECDGAKAEDVALDLEEFDGLCPDHHEASQRDQHECNAGDAANHDASL